MKRQKIKRLGSRTMMSGSEFYERNYASAGLPRELVLELLDGLGNALEVPPGLLRPSDRFQVELAPLKGWGAMDDRLDLYDLMTRVEKKYDIKLRPSEIETVDHYIRSIGRAAVLRE